MIEVERRDMEKLSDALAAVLRHHRPRDEMNAALHLAGVVRYSPLTVEVEAVAELVQRYLSEASE